jgi:hypothetical protein
LLYGKRNRRYRVYYSVQPTTPSTGIVRVFHMRHWGAEKPEDRPPAEIDGQPYPINPNAGK